MRVSGGFQVIITIPLMSIFSEVFMQALFMLRGREVRFLYPMLSVLYFLVHYLIALDENKPCLLDY